MRISGVAIPAAQVAEPAAIQNGDAGGPEVGADFLSIMTDCSQKLQSAPDYSIDDPQQQSIQQTPDSNLGLVESAELSAEKQAGIQQVDPVALIATASANGMPVRSLDQEQKESVPAGDEDEVPAPSSESMSVTLILSAMLPYQTTVPPIALPDPAFAGSQGSEPAAPASSTNSGAPLTGDVPATGQMPVPVSGTVAASVSASVTPEVSAPSFVAPPSPTSIPMPLPVPASTSTAGDFARTESRKSLPSTPRTATSSEASLPDFSTARFFSRMQSSSTTGNIPIPEQPLASSSPAVPAVPVREASPAPGLPPGQVTIDFPVDELPPSFQLDALTVKPTVPPPNDPGPASTRIDILPQEAKASIPAPVKTESTPGEPPPADTAAVKTSGESAAATLSPRPQVVDSKKTTGLSEEKSVAARTPIRSSGGESQISELPADTEPKSQPGQAARSGEPGRPAVDPDAIRKTAIFEERAAGVHPSSNPAVPPQGPPIAAPRAGSVASPRAPEFLTQLADQIRLNLQGGNGEIRIQLKPEFLGHIEIKAESGVAGIVARISAGSETVKAFLEGNLHVLQQTLQDQGLKVDRIEVNIQTSLDDRPSAGQQHLGESHGGSGRETSRHPSGRTASASPGIEGAPLEVASALAYGPNSTFHTVA